MLGSKSQTVHISSLPSAYEQERGERRERQIIKHLRLYSFGAGG